MNLEVLISCMHQTDASIVERSRITSDALIINQCDEARPEVLCPNPVSGRKIRMISTDERGLSRSRNRAIQHAVGTICLLCDDDEVFAEGYEEVILNAFRALPDADVIAFKIANQPCSLKDVPQKLSCLQLLKIKSWQIAFRRDRVIGSGILFDEYMGAGSGNGAQEENKFLLDCHKKKLQIYYVPSEIAAVAQQQSTWFSGFSELFFYQRGIATRHMLGFPVSVIYAFYYTIAKRSLYRGQISAIKALGNTLQGIFCNDIQHQIRRDSLKRYRNQRDQENQI